MMQATAVIERIRRAISETSDSVNTRLQPISSAFGKAFKVDDWAVELFAEEVVRGGPAFAVSFSAPWSLVSELLLSWAPGS